MASVARTDNFLFALFLWLFGSLSIALWGGCVVLGMKGDTPLWVGLVGGVVLTGIATYLLMKRSAVVQRMSSRMSRWGLGVAQLTFLAYVIVMPVYFFIALFDRTDPVDH